MFLVTYLHSEIRTEMFWNENENEKNEKLPGKRISKSFKILQFGGYLST